MRLTIKYTQTENFGFYECQASNSEGSGKASVELMGKWKRYFEATMVCLSKSWTNCFYQPSCTSPMQRDTCKLTIGFCDIKIFVLKYLNPDLLNLGNKDRKSLTVLFYLKMNHVCFISIKQRIKFSQLISHRFASKCQKIVITFCSYW